MFESVTTAPPDAILGLSEAFQKDTNPDKINLSVGVYQDSAGKTPVLRCVKEAERRLIEQEGTKSYLGIDGLPDYRRHVHELLFGDALPEQRTAVIQTPGGTGGLRVAADFLTGQFPESRVWISSPTWANHTAIFQAASVPVEMYRYLNTEKTGLDFEGMISDLSSGASPGDAVLLHACCHNPTGVDPSAEQWQQIADLLCEKQLLPFIDFAYQGFGDGLEQDAQGLRTLLSQCPEALIASSFSKNFGLYSERVGAAVLVATEQTAAVAAQSQLKRVVRSNYSNPPRHGGAIVATVLDDPQLTSLWHEELDEMRSRIATMRVKFVEKMHRLQNQRDFSFLLDQKGMFSFSGLNPMQVDQLRSEHSVYIVGSGRINVAGITDANIERLCQAIVAVL
ncbi:MAG: amino acid aminotransferase [Pirellulaceae bacterium]